MKWQLRYMLHLKATEFFLVTSLALFSSFVVALLAHNLDSRYLGVTLYLNKLFIHGQWKVTPLALQFVEVTSEILTTKSHDTCPP